VVDLIVMNRNGHLVVKDDKGHDRERYEVVYGAHMKVKDGQTVESGQILVEWDPYTFSILTEEKGQVRFKDIIEGTTVHEAVDEVTGLSRYIIVDSPDEKKQPTIEIRDAKGTVIRRYIMPVSAHMMVSDSEEVRAGDVLAKIPRETTKTKDITGGLPRVVELFEARKPRETAVISEIDGIVKHGGIVKGQRKIIIVPDEPGAEPREYSLPRGVHVNVQEGDRVRAGEPLMDGPSNPHDILNVLGEKELQKYLVNEIQEVYRLQGVNINDKHIEVISRQMMRWVKIEDVGDTEFLIDEQVDKFRFLSENERVLADSGRPATAQPLLLGITKASLSTESFISAASFQETTKVLTEAAIWGKVDHLNGLKENVIMGRLIPADRLRVLPDRADSGRRAAAAAAAAAAERGGPRARPRDGVLGGARGSDGPPRRAARVAGRFRPDRMSEGDDRGSSPFLLYWHPGRSCLSGGLDRSAGDPLAVCAAGRDRPAHQSSGTEGGVWLPGVALAAPAGWQIVRRRSGGVRLFRQPDGRQRSRRFALASVSGPPAMGWREISPAPAIAGR
jgi:hypothetical protein